MEGFLPAAISHFNTGAAGAHFAVCRDGKIVLLCPLEDIAHHAGTDGNRNSRTFGRTPFWRTHNINAHSVGVELEGFAGQEFTEAQIESCVALGRWLTDKFGILPMHTFDEIDGHHAHSEISSRRSDPGSTFPFADLMSALQEVP